MSIRQFHRLSACLLAAYILLHLANHLVAVAGAHAHIAFMEATRPLYRNAVVEPVLLACVLFQCGSEIWMTLRRWKERSGFVAWLQAGSGIYLALFLLFHVGAVLFGRAALRLDTNFYYAAAGFVRMPYALFFAPYYFFAVYALFTHLGCAAYWQVKARSPMVRRLAMGVPAGVGLVVALLIDLALAGMLHPLDIPAKYLTIYQ
ncbi:hypothetical protein [Janthinobacterium sp. PAMC25594]|uniref:hypothetical protein n=1 Tax=Janthinobacterium sp. PAMC25594 TaxID=2861284 RepID=UPI001C62BD81|nr:hypothetical protein [Janthinobacterium sp. PAMC25594]QYG07112.1 hypothetical protein KY494_28670 [Janthinobacterium sp. PAMC25594]